MKRGHLILINGGSSAGKSSTCRVFQGLTDEPYVHLGIDQFWYAIPPKQLQIANAEPRYYRTQTYYENDKPYFQIMPGPLLDEVIYGSYKAIASYLELGINVISDQLFWKPKWFRVALDTFNSYSVFFVGLIVSDDEGARREQQRSQGGAQHSKQENRPDGWNRCSSLITHKNMVYDFEIDNTKLSINETAQQLLLAVKNCKNPTAFKNLYCQENLTAISLTKNAGNSDDT